MPIRCSWVPIEDALYIDYHDNEWGVPVHDDRLLYEFLTLEGFQAGLSWRTVLAKRENFRAAFDGFDPAIVAGYGEAKIAELLGNPGIIRNRSKITAAITNAQAFLRLQQAFGSFDAYIWEFVGGKPVHNRWTAASEIPPRSALSDALSKDLLQRGFKYVGSTICYAHMQATGMVNDHTTDCFRHGELSSARDGALNR
ncbi:MAG: DNA-3-methyladenine glycosylase I [Anaerolineales bacterium]|nr:DNA-3-methyladenine glycosylase I [Anaerolineales bacterium]